MLRKKPFLRIILIFTISLAGLLLIYPVIHQPYLDFIVNIGNKYLAHPDKEALVKFLVNPESKDLDLRIHISNTRQMVTDPNAMMWISKASSFYLAWIYLALMFALILASPVKPLKKLALVLPGFIVVHLLVYAKLLIQVYYVCNQHPDLQLLIVSPDHMKWVSMLLDQFVDTVQPSLIIVVLSWMLMTFTLKDYKNLMEKFPKTIQKKKV
jgi:hypothetical protein